MLEVKSFYFNPLQERTILLWNESLEAVVVDPGCYTVQEVEELLNFVKDKSLTIKAIWLTHGHFDHIFGIVKILEKNKGIDVFMHPDDKAMLSLAPDMAKNFGLQTPDINFITKDIKEGDILYCGNNQFKVIETPGHTPGSVCFYNKEAKLLLSGDTLFAGSIGRSDMALGNYDTLIVSIMEKLMFLDGDVVIIPGHGPMSDISYERTHNPFLQPFNEEQECLLEDFN